jgi:hypothetical protein
LSGRYIAAEDVGRRPRGWGRRPETGGPARRSRGARACRPTSTRSGLPSLRGRPEPTQLTWRISRSPWMCSRAVAWVASWRQLTCSVWDAGSWPARRITNLAILGWLPDLHAREILYVPDFLANCGGIIHVAADVLGFDRDEVNRRTNTAIMRTRIVLADARTSGRPPIELAMKLVSERLQRAVTSDPVRSR